MKVRYNIGFVVGPREGVVFEDEDSVWEKLRDAGLFAVLEKAGLYNPVEHVVYEFTD